MTRYVPAAGTATLRRELATRVDAEVRFDPGGHGSAHENGG